ncbi:MAG: hypothetical protein U0903_21710 [Planctomycetales bacterium]
MTCWAGLVAALILTTANCQADLRSMLIRGQSPDNGQYADPGNGGYDYCDQYGRPCRGRYPREWYRFSYQTPRNLTYPAPNMQPAVVQYPYYTLKGPDCFFYNGSTTRY